MDFIIYYDIPKCQILQCAKICQGISDAFINIVSLWGNVKTENQHPLLKGLLFMSLAFFVFVLFFISNALYFNKVHYDMQF